MHSALETLKTAFLHDIPFEKGDTVENLLKLDVQGVTLEFNPGISSWGFFSSITLRLNNLSVSWSGSHGDYFTKLQSLIQIKILDHVEYLKKNGSEGLPVVRCVINLLKYTPATLTFLDQVRSNHATFEKPSVYQMDGDLYVSSGKLLIKIPGEQRRLNDLTDAILELN